MNHWRKFWFVLLIAMFGGVVLVLGKVAWLPESGVYRVQPLAFPPAVPLSEWQIVESRTVLDSRDPRFKMRGGRDYQYQRDTLGLIVKARYFTDTDGDLSEILKEFERQSPTLDTRKEINVGEYAVWISDGRAFLSACINSQGGSTVTEDQFMRDRVAHDRTVGRFLLWASGQKPLYDKRCLWTVLSLQMKGRTADEALQDLEAAWRDWHSWWNRHFPTP